MPEVEFQIEVERTDAPDDPLLDEQEIMMLLDSTREQVLQHIARRVGDLVCEEHGKPPKIIVSGAYSLDTEQLDLNYNIDACCNLMTMRTAALLARA